MSILRTILNATAMYGWDFRRMVRSARGLPAFVSNYRQFKRLSGRNAPFPVHRFYPCLTDRYEGSGLLSDHYFHQDLYVAQLIHRNNPVRHVDVGSRVDGFVAHVAASREIEVFDIREQSTTATNIKFQQADIMNVDARWREYTDSLSCLHTIEHFGLGRYGDPVDPQGHERGWDGLYAMLRRNGKLYFSTPIGRDQRVEFNAHRVFGLPLLTSMMRDRYRIDSFAYIDDAGELHTNAHLDAPAARDTFGLRFGCGIFELTKI